MILEALEYAVTPAPHWARRAGLLGEAVALRARAGRCAEAWRPHLRHSRDAIMRASADLPRTELAVVLGSGPCLDVPVDVMLRRFRRIVLVDAVHPISIRMRKPANVRLVTADLSHLPNEEAAACALLDEDIAPDFVVSANVLAQLPLFPTGPEAGNALMRGHLEGVFCFGGRKMLISDMVRRVTDAEGKVLEIPLLDGLNLPEPKGQWRWLVVPPGERADGVEMETDVGYWVWD